MTHWGAEPPRWFVRTCIAVLVAGTVLTFVGAVRIGVTVDETFHVLRLRNYLDHGWYLLDDDLVSGVPGSWVADSFVYAPVTTLLLHLPNVALGNETWSDVSASSDAYVVRHVGVAVLALVALAAAAAMTRLVSGTWRWAPVAGAVLVCLPMWSGHAMFNVKDVPVATGYTLVTLGCMLALVVPRRASARVAAAATILLGLVLAMGTRPAIWPGLAAALGVLLLAVLSGRLAGGREWWRLADATAAGVGSVAVLVAVYPSVFGHPLRLLLGSASESAGYHGERFWAYIPVAVACTVPLVLLFFGTLGAVVRLRRRLSRPVARVGVHDVLTVLVVLQALLLPAILLVRVPSLNGGLRHLLFAAPAVAVLVSAGIARVLADSSGRTARTLVPAVAAAGLAVPLVTQVQLFPYGYAYANPLVDAVGTDLSADFWQASLREQAEDVPDGAFVVCGARPDGEGRVLRQIPNGGQSWLELGQDCAAPDRVSVLRPFLDEALPAASVPSDAVLGDAVLGDFIALSVDDEALPGCEELGRVTRNRLVTDVVVSRMFRCPLVLEPYAGPIRLDGAGAGAAHLLGGWSGNGGASSVTALDRASLGADLGGAPSGRLTVSVEGHATGEADFLLNNVPAEVRTSATGWVVTPATTLPQVGRPGNVVLTVVAAEGSVDVSEVTFEEETR